MAETYDRILSMLNDMDAEKMPNERRALILAMMVEKPTDADRAWAASFAPLPDMPGVKNG